MIKNIFNKPQQKKEVRKGVEITLTKSNFHKIKLPTEVESLNLDKDDRFILAEIEGDLCLIVVNEDIRNNEDLMKYSVKYNVTDNSLNSKKVSDKIRTMFEMDEATFNLEATLESKEGYNYLILSDESGEFEESEEEERELKEEKIFNS